MSHNYPIKRHSFGGLTEQDKREADIANNKGKLVYEVKDMTIRDAFKLAESKRR